MTDSTTFVRYVMPVLDAVGDHDLWAPIPRCGSRLKGAKLAGLVTQDPDGILTLTEAGRRLRAQGGH